MSDHYLELVLDGDLSQAEVEAAVQHWAKADRAASIAAHPGSGWNGLSVLFRHRWLMGVATLTQARDIVEQFQIGDGIAVRVRNDVGAVPTSWDAVVQSAETATAPVASPAVPAPTTVEPETGDMPADEAGEVVVPQGPAYEETPEAQPLIAKRDQYIARMQSFGEEIVERMKGQSSKTRGCTDCGSSVAVTHIKASPGKGHFTTIRCPVCDADDFCIQATDVERRSSLERQYAKIEIQISEGKAAFLAGNREAPALEAEASEGTVEEPAPDIVDDPADDGAAAILEPVAPMGRREKPDMVWIVAGYVKAAARAA